MKVAAREKEARGGAIISNSGKKYREGNEKKCGSRGASPAGKGFLLLEPRMSAGRN